MTPEQFEAFMAHMATFDRRLANIERDSADSAAAIEEMAKNQAKLSELYIALDQRQEDAATITQNYIDATKALRQEASNLNTLVRQKLKAAGG